MSTWNVTAMGQVGLSGVASKIARWFAPKISAKTGWSQANILAVIGAGFLAASLLDFLRTVDAVVAAGRSGRPSKRVAARAPSSSS